MPVPSPRTPICIARGRKADLQGNVTALEEGEVVFATDEGQLYVLQKVGGVPQLVLASKGGLVAGNGVSANSSSEIAVFDTGTF